MKKIMSLVIMLIVIVSLVGCDYDEKLVEGSTVTEKNISVKTERTMSESDRKVGFPNITNFYEKYLLKELYELRDDSDLICYAYTKSEVNNKYIYEGRCIGYGLPYSVQFSSSEKLGTVDGGQYGAENPYTLPQCEPNGLYMPDSLSATWLILINDKGEREPAYYEPQLVVRQSKIRKELCEPCSLPENY